ncbi:hypothetical protein NL676_005802 [Syzygium grande]|nr:hypothetical protein NL676_005802 [Syzygium grande]
MEAPLSLTSAVAAGAGAGSLHIAAMPYPGRGHINPMMNLCKILSSRAPEITVTFVVTEEWLGFIGDEPKPANISFATIPNVLPSELVRAQHYSEFNDAVLAKMGGPFEELLDRLRPAPSVIVADTFLSWALRTANRRNIPVASFWPTEKGDERVDHIPGQDLISSGRIDSILQNFLDAFSIVREAKYLLLATVYEVEYPAVDALKANFSFPVHTIGPAIHFSGLADDSCLNDAEYLKWLDCRPSNSVLYISLGSFLSVSGSKMDEIAGCLRDSGIRFMWLVREEATRLRELCGGRGIVVPWRDQLRVLSHSSVGGFWMHCGWNSIWEAIFTGVPLLAYPIAMDQGQYATLVVEDLKVGWRVGTDVKGLVREGRRPTPSLYLPTRLSMGQLSHVQEP